jgi:hypothetical protein
MLGLTSCFSDHQKYLAAQNLGSVAFIFAVFDYPTLEKYFRRMMTTFSVRQNAHFHPLTCHAQFDKSHFQARQPTRTATATRSDANVPSLWKRCAVSVALVATQALAITTLVTVTAPPPAFANTENYTIDVRPGEDEVEDQYFQTVPQGLSISAEDKAPRVALGKMLEGKKGKEVQQCVRKCVPTCTRTGQGSPGLGPMTARKEMVVFKEGYHSRQYCLSECVQVCNITINKPAAAKPTP